MHRVDVTNPGERWQYKCQHCESENWRCFNDSFGCNRCGETSRELVDAVSGELVPREEFEFVGPEASHKAVSGYPPGRGGYR